MLFEIIIERVVDFVGSTVERFRSIRRIYIYGAGRVGKTSFLDKLTKAKRTTLQIKKDNYQPTPSDEDTVYKQAGTEIGSQYVDVVLQFYSYGGQMKDENDEIDVTYINARKKNFNEVKPHAVIFVASPRILERSWDEDSGFPDDEVLRRNRESLEELYNTLSSHSDTAKHCDFIQPIVSHKDIWKNDKNYIDDDHYIANFGKDYESLLANFANINVRVLPWMGYSLDERAEILLILERVLEELGIDGSILRGLLGL